MYEVWLVAVDHEGLPLEKISKVQEYESFDDAVHLASTYRGGRDKAFDICRNGRYISWTWPGENS